MKDSKELIKNRKEMRNEMVNEYGYLFCQYCESSQAFKFEWHHLVYRSERPGHEKLHSRENLILLCSSCHGKFHSRKDKRNDLVTSRGLDKIFDIGVW